MSILAQLEAVTNDWFLIENGKAEDNYFETSFLLDYFLKQKKGIWKRPSGGVQISIPIRYDGNKAGFYARGGVLDSTKQEAITQINLAWKHAYGNCTILRIDELKNSGPEGLINLTSEELEGGQESLRDILATSFYTGTEGDASNLTGLNAVCDTTATTNYGGFCSNDIVSQDSTQVWAGLGSSSATVMSLSALRDIKTASAYGKGKMAQPDFMATTEALYDVLLNILQVQQRFTEGVKPAKAGFSGVHFEGTDVFPDRYCPASNLYAINSKHVGFAVHSQGLFQRTPWEFIAGSARDKTMKIFFDGNAVCNNRRANYRHSSLS
ncbi:MAG: phage major capsid protein [Methanosarcinaceae archaeon]|nr:phage major capsid protein [Methanosarcinaceae archaeon]